MTEKSYIEKVAEGKNTVVCMVTAIKEDNSPFYAYFMVPRNVWQEEETNVEALLKYLTEHGALLASGSGSRPDEKTEKAIRQIIEQQLIIEEQQS